MRSLLYRYLFFGWLYRNVNQGNVFERRAALRFNIEHCFWLLTYLRRWSTITGVFLAMGWLLELAGFTFGCAGCMVFGILGIIYLIVTGLIYLVLRHLTKM